MSERTMSEFNFIILADRSGSSEYRRHAGRIVKMDCNARDYTFHLPRPWQAR